MPAIGCSYKAAAGFMYPLERGFIYVHKPPMHIRFEEIACVNFARSGGSTRSFDFEIETRNGVVHIFSSIEKLFSFSDPFLFFLLHSLIEFTFRVTSPGKSMESFSIS